MGKTSVSILVFGWSVLILGVTGLSLTLNLNHKPVKHDEGQQFLKAGCPQADSYYKKSDLTLAERDYFTGEASAYEIISAENKRYRVILNASVTNEKRKKVHIGYFLKSLEKTSMDLFEVKFLIDGVSISSKPEKIDNNLALGNIETELSNEKSFLGIDIQDNGVCAFRENNLIELRAIGKIDSSLPKNVISNFEKSTLTLVPGINYFSSKDWFDSGYFVSKGFNVLNFNQSQKKWVKIKSGKILFPSVVYLIYNPANTTIKMERPDPHRVPNDINSYPLAKGWNLLKVSNFEAKEEKYSYNFNRNLLVADELLSLDDLLKKQLIYKTAYSSEGNVIKEVEVKDAVSKEGYYWFYLKENLKNDLKQVNLSINIKASDDSYKTRQIPIKVEIKNNDTRGHYLIPSGLWDSCQLKMVIKNSSGNIINVEKNRCSSWVNLEELLPGAKKEYNYIWKASKAPSGEYVARVYLDYSRLGEHKIFDEVKIKLI